MMRAELEPCRGCGALVPCGDGPTHRYIGASPGCWAVFGEVLAREYSDRRYWPVYQLTVDAYAVQHPGEPSRQTIQSAAIHLISLYSVLEAGRTFDQAKMRPNAPVRRRCASHGSSRRLRVARSRFSTSGRRRAQPSTPSS